LNGAQTEKSYTEKMIGSTGFAATAGRRVPRTRAWKDGLLEGSLSSSTKKSDTMALSMGSAGARDHTVSTIGPSMCSYVPQSEASACDE